MKNMKNKSAIRTLILVLFKHLKVAKKGGTCYLKRSIWGAIFPSKIDAEIDAEKIMHIEEK